MMTSIINLGVQDRVRLKTLTLMPYNREVGAASGGTMIQIFTSLEIIGEVMEILEGTMRTNNASHKEEIEGKNLIKKTTTK